MNIASHTKYSFVLIFFVAILTKITACSRPQAAPQNRELITSLRTAVSARKTDWLEINVKKIEDRRAAGEVSDLFCGNDLTWGSSQCSKFVKTLPTETKKKPLSVLPVVLEMMERF